MISLRPDPMLQRSFVDKKAGVWLLLKHTEHNQNRTKQSMLFLRLALVKKCTCCSWVCLWFSVQHFDNLCSRVFASVALLGQPSPIVSAQLQSGFDLGDATVRTIQGLNSSNTPTNSIMFLEYYVFCERKSVLFYSYLFLCLFHDASIPQLLCFFPQIRPVPLLFFKNVFQEPQMISNHFAATFLYIPGSNFFLEMNWWLIFDGTNCRDDG